MLDFYEESMQPAYEHMHDLVVDCDPFPDSYMVIRNGKSVRKVIVANLLGEHVVWKIDGKKMEKVFDFGEVPF